MNREGAETFLRLLAEAEIHGPMTPPGRAAWSGDAPVGSTCQMMILVAEVLTAVHALAPETAQEILADFDLAAIVRPHEVDLDRPAPGAQAWAARPRPGLVRVAPHSAGPRPSKYWRPFPGQAIRWGPQTAAPAGETAPAPRSDLDRFEPIGLALGFREDEFTGELCLMSYARIASQFWFTAIWRARASLPMPTLGWGTSGVLSSLFTVTDDRGRCYDLDFAGGFSGRTGHQEWAGLIGLKPDPPDDIRWLDVRGQGGSVVRVELTQPDTTAGPELTVSEVAPSAGERLLTMIAERLLTVAAELPPVLWTGLPTVSPGPLAAMTTGLGQVIAALEAADVLSPVSPVPGWLATLCASLYVGGHGITAPPTPDLPEPWLSLLSHYQRRKPDTGGAHDGYAALAATLPELDGIGLVLLGLHNTGGDTSVMTLASGVTMEGLPGPYNIEWDFPLSLWFRDSGGRWHAARPWGWHVVGERYSLKLRLMPPLPRSATWIEVLAAGWSAQVRAKLPLRWGYPP
jgi:hypothetical protein